MYRSIFDHASDAILYISSDGLILTANAKAADLFHVRLQDLLGKKPEDFMVSANQDEDHPVAHHFAQAAAKRNTRRTKMNVRSPRGVLRPVEIHTNPVFKKQTLEGFVSVIRTLSGRTMPDDTTWNDEEQFRMLFENANDGIVYLDKNAVIRASNKKIEDLFGYSREEVLGRRFMEFAIFSPDDMKNTYEVFLDSIQGTLPPLLEFEGFHRNGRRFFLEINPTLIKEKEDIVGIVAIIRDISHRKQSERERARLIDIIEATPDFVITYDAYGNITYINKAGRKKFGLTPGEDYMNVASNGIREALPSLAGRGIWTGENALVLENNRVLHVSQVIMAHGSGTDGKPHFSTIMRDISDQKHNENHIKDLTHHLIRIQEDERARIARDLHDNLAQDLSSLKIQCETLFDIDADVPSCIRRKISDMSWLFKKTIDSVRDITYNLRPASLHELGLVNTLYQFCDDFQNSRRYVFFHTAGMQKVKLDFDTEINLYRITQEAFNNIRKHAEADTIKVNLTASYPNIILQIEDNGIGFELGKRKKELIHEKRMGLKSIEERVGLLNGTFRIQSKQSIGTMIHVEVPYNPSWPVI